MQFVLLIFKNMIGRRMLAKKQRKNIPKLISKLFGFKKPATMHS
jgi:hypothetical protein